MHLNLFCRGAYQTSERNVIVKFHVLISEKFQFDPEHQKVIIVMGHQEMGGWNRKDREMKVER